jgi:hypothetical protein
VSGWSPATAAAGLSSAADWCLIALVRTVVRAVKLKDLKVLALPAASHPGDSGLVREALGVWQGAGRHKAPGGGPDGCGSRTERFRNTVEKELRRPRHARTCRIQEMLATRTDALSKMVFRPRRREQVQERVQGCAYSERLANGCESTDIISLRHLLLHIVSFLCTDPERAGTRQ